MKIFNFSCICLSLFNVVLCEICIILSFINDYHEIGNDNSA